MGNMQEAIFHSLLTVAAVVVQLLVTIQHRLNVLHALYGRLLRRVIVIVVSRDAGKRIVIKDSFHFHLTLSAQKAALILPFAMFAE
jgi:hypothetical protein